MKVYTVVVKYVQGINEIDLARNQTSQQSITLLYYVYFKYLVVSFKLCSN